MKQTNPKKYFLIVASVLVVVLGGVLYYYTEIGAFYAYLISINIITFITYGYDKHKARKGKLRIPELVLHLLGLAGGSPGALIGQLTFRHKTKKIKFQVIFWVIVAVQAFLLYRYIDGLQ